MVSESTLSVNIGAGLVRPMSNENRSVNGIGDEFYHKFCIGKPNSAAINDSFREFTRARCYEEGFVNSLKEYMTKAYGIYGL